MCLFKTAGIFFHPIQSLRCGTTGVVTFIRGNMLHVAWLGDSQVMLVRRGQAVELMKPHKPDREVRMACFKYTRVVFTTEADRYQLYVGCWDTLPVSLGAAAYIPVILVCLEVGMDLCASPLFSSVGACSLRHTVFVKTANIYRSVWSAMAALSALSKQLLCCLAV